MKRNILILATFFILQTAYSQTVDVNKLRFCIGKINSINQLFGDDQTRKPVITNKVLEDEEFNVVWEGLINDTKNFTQVSLGKKYAILLEYDSVLKRTDNSDYYGWEFNFISNNKIKVTRWDRSTAIASSSNLDFTYDLNNNNYNLKLEFTQCGVTPSGFGHICSTDNIIINNDKLVKRYRTN
jgi:hypothetical protein